MKRGPAPLTIIRGSIRFVCVCVCVCVYLECMSQQQVVRTLGKEIQYPHPRVQTSTMTIHKRTHVNTVNTSDHHSPRWQHPHVLLPPQVSWQCPCGLSYRPSKGVSSHPVTRSIHLFMGTLVVVIFPCVYIYICVCACIQAKWMATQENKATTTTRTNINDTI